MMLIHSYKTQFIMFFILIIFRLEIVFIKKKKNNILTNH